jgi:Fe-S oxidoreductase
MLDHAKKMLADILVSMQQEIRADIPVVGLEPSCVSVFRDELKRVFPYDEDAQRLSKNAMTISEFLVEHSQFEFPKVNRKAIVHGHCHDKAVMKMKCEADLFKKIGLEFEILDSGCCGMAGSFGFESEHFEISEKVGERILLPRVRETPQENFVIAEGFSCREQIEQLANRRALHTAEVLLKVLREGSYTNPEGKKIEAPHTVPEMQEQSQLKNRTKTEPVEIGHEH